MPYSFITLTQAQQDLQSRLYNLTGDTTQQFWTLPELTLYIQEALRTWNSLTSFFRGDFSFTLSQGVWWYDIPSAAGSLRPYTVTDFLLLQQMEASLLEPLSPSYPLVWGGSNQFGISDLLGALQRKRDEIFSDTTCTITRSLITASTSLSRTVLADNILTLRRIAWLPNSGSPQTLFQSDVESKTDFDYLFGGPGVPFQWLQQTEPALAFDVDYIPTVAGNYELLTVNAGPSLSTSSSTLLGLPDDWSWVVKFGALADLLSRESNSKDSPRAAYCDQRFQDGKKLLSKASALLVAKVNGVPISVDAARNGDDFNANWQALPQGLPTAIYTAGLNLLGVAPAPNATPPTLSLTVVQNAVVPVVGGDFLQVGRDDYDSLIDYAQHLAAFKLGGAEFEQTLPLFQNFLSQAKIYNSALSEMGFFQRPVYEVSKLEEERNPVYAKGGDSE